ncbi:hypothetical protein P3X46_031206 [Hevea brasiliensis]|uniref:COBRA C-terminal domain-containing protein n=1 Tax=Hevea brasiliensis TaxID=3981 RepID=A0ABQ9KJJ4_HEVBR|nr:hypothetical protein P3X46_031206 [Hevea brasiliensis]
MEFCRLELLIVSAILRLMAILLATAYDPLDPYGIINIKWDVMSWTPDGYVVSLPGWTLGWTWARKEGIWSIVGAQATDQGEWSKLKGNIPYCCKRNPAVVDLLPGVPKNHQFTDCCKGWLTWIVTCSYLQMLASKKQTCCVSLSSFYNSKITPCPSCACGCQNEHNCAMSQPKISSVVESNTPVLQCTEHTCPIRVHWHVKSNYKEYWSVKISITNFNYWMNYTQWTLVAQHPNLNNITKVYKFVYKPLMLYNSLNETGMFYGVEDYNDLLLEAGPDGNVQSEMLLGKDKNRFTFHRGWSFPLKIYFNGDECMMPPPDSYPFLPNSANLNLVASSTLVTFLLLIMLVIHHSNGH